MQLAYEPLPRAFYARDTVRVARDLLGKLLVRVMDGKVLSGMIVETEAYTADDPASHAYKGMSKRNRVMFGDVGYAYIYFIYGNHYCLNVVAKDPSVSAGAVLIRALEPVDGIEVMVRVRGGKHTGADKVTTGPGRLTRALSITKEYNGMDLTTKGPLYIAYYNSIEDEHVLATSRIGISKARDRLWRFIVKGNRYISKE